MTTIPEAFALAVAHQQGGRLPEAEAIYRRILADDPRHAHALYMLGVLAHQGRRADLAVEYLQSAIAIEPAEAMFHNEFGNLLQGLRRFDEAIASFERARQLQPQTPQVHFNLGNALRAAGQNQAAEASYRQAIALAPDFAPAYNNLGTLRQSLGDLIDAEHCYRQAVQFDPAYAKAHYNLGALLHKRVDWDGAHAAYRRAIELRPDYAPAHYNLGVMFQELWRGTEAVNCFEEALRLEPEFSQAYTNLAAVYNDMNQPDMAIECCRKGLERDPLSASLFSNLSGALQTLGRLDEALACVRKAVELRPEGVGEHTNLLYKLNFHPAYDPASIFREHLQWAARHAEPLTALAAPHANDRNPDRRLRIGYVSPYFREHAVNFFSEPLIVAHDHRAVEVFCYSDVLFADAATPRLRAAADHWRETRHLSDQELADAVRADGIDILVDLTGHIAGNRLLAFARKPAPVQVTYLGYQNTTGMSAMDYRLTDAWADPCGQSEPYYTEQLVRLPRSFFCYRPSDDAPAVGKLPALERGFVTFGSFNNFAKVGPRVVETWLDLLERVAASRLMILARGGGSAQQRLQGLAQARGLDAARIEFCDKRPRRAYLELFAGVDIALDPFPFNGHTTTCDAIWMGVPVVMLSGHAYASRFGGSVLTNVGLDHLIADAPERYVELAAELAANRQGLAELRGALRGRMAASALLDAEGFTRNLEAEYRRMWRRWCASCGPDVEI